MGQETERLSSDGYKSSSERKAKLKEVMKSLNKKFKNPNLLKMGDSELEKETISTGISEIDGLTGGFTKGNFSVVYGVKSSGKTTLALQTIAQNQKEGKICCLIDLEHSFDIMRATQLGVNLEELILINEIDDAEQAMDIMISLAKEQVIDFIVLDSVQGMSPRGEQETKKGKEKSLADETMALLARQLGAFFRRCSTPIFKGKVAVLMIGQVRTHGIGSFFTYDGLSGGKALIHFAHKIIYIRPGQKADAPQGKWKEIFLDPDGKMHKQTKKESIGFSTVLKLEKTKSSKSKVEGSEIKIPFYFDSGFVVPEEKEIEEKIVGTEEEKEKILQMLSKESVKETCKILAKDDKACKELAENYCNAKDEDLSRGEEKLIETEKPKKKKRGRPRKSKEKK